MSPNVPRVASRESKSSARCVDTAPRRSGRHAGCYSVSIAWRNDDELLEAAAALDPRVLRSLDAIHLAAAQLFGDELTAVVTYDRRMTSAAESIDLAVVAPREASA
jgi:predicted nucleic acid-binding protein